MASGSIPVSRARCAQLAGVRAAAEEEEENLENRALLVAGRPPRGRKRAALLLLRVPAAAAPSPALGKPVVGLAAGAVEME